MATSQDHDFYRPLTPEGHPGPPPFVSRPAPRPAVEPAAAQLFGRPAGVFGAFADQPGEAIREQAAAPPTPEALAAAFGRPSTSDERLQRPPGRNGARPSAALAGEDGFWPQGAGRDPWRDPWAAAVLGAPAVGRRDVDADEPPRPGARLSVAEVLFGRRLSNRALAALATVALLIGGVGGLVGRLTADGGTLLHDPGITLAQVQP
ncbi:MAG: serine protease, partial [Pseudonocardiales bacterium]|nr:serine protease [Pseudonocardiales bacterium]